MLDIVPARVSGETGMAFEDEELAEELVLLGDDAESTKSEARRVGGGEVSEDGPEAAPEATEGERPVGIRLLGGGPTKVVLEPRAANPVTDVEMLKDDGTRGAEVNSGAGSRGGASRGRVADATN
jgi:hypothetical protein